MEVFKTYLGVLEAGLVIPRPCFRPKEPHRCHSEPFHQSIYTLVEGTNLCLEGPHVLCECVNLGNQSMAKAQKGEKYTMPREVSRYSSRQAKCSWVSFSYFRQLKVTGLDGALGVTPAGPKAKSKWTSSKNKTTFVSISNKAESIVLFNTILKWILDKQCRYENRASIIQMIIKRKKNFYKVYEIHLYIRGIIKFTIMWITVLWWCESLFYDSEASRDRRVQEKCWVL